MGNAQNVGINDPAPTAKLTVKGTETTPDGQAAAIKLQNTAGNTNAWYLRAGGTGNTTPNGGFSIADNIGYRFNITNTGNIGIGTTTPSEQLTLSSGNISLLSSNKGILLNGVDGPMINRGFDPFTSGNYTGLGRWGLFMEPNNLTIGIPAIALKAFAVSSYNNNSTINKQLFRVSLNAAATNALVQVNGEMKIEGLNTLEFGAGLTKEINAGKIGYQTFTAGALDIIGAGTLVANRKVNIFAEGGTTFNGPINVGGSTGTTGQVLTSNGTAAPIWANTATSNDVRFKANFGASSNSGLEPTITYSTVYNFNSTAVSISASLITINRSGLYHIEGYYETIHDFHIAPPSTLVISSYLSIDGGQQPITLFEGTNRDLNYATSPVTYRYRKSIPFVREQYINAPATVYVTVSSTVIPGSSTSGFFARYGEISGYLISD
jgi:hypothetical protein